MHTWLKENRLQPAEREEPEEHLSEDYEDSDFDTFNQVTYFPNSLTRHQSVGVVSLTKDVTGFYYFNLI